MNMSLRTPVRRPRTLTDFNDIFSLMEKQFVGLDSFLSHFENARRVGSGSYPPHNIDKLSETDYRISLAVAGFSEDDIKVELKDHVLTVSGSHDEDETTEDNDVVIYRGIANRSFNKMFKLNENVEVTGASLKNGLLTIDLSEIIPEEEKPVRININTG